MMKPLTIGVLVTMTMAAVIAYGIVAGDFVEGLRTVLGDPWGRVTMIDLAAGLTVVGAWIAWRQGIKGAVPWWIALVLTGNLATGVYIIKAARNSGSATEFLSGRSASDLR